MTLYVVFLDMKKSTTLSRLQRLDLLAARLKTDEALIVRDLAAELGVSGRTLARDIELLRDRGLPIEADRGRGGGVRLHWSWGIGRINLNYQEAVDLLVSLAVIERLQSPILLANLTSIRRKLMASFSPKSSHEINRLKARILIAETASLFVQASIAQQNSSSIEKLHQAFLTCHSIKIDYTDAEETRTAREIEPHYLLLSYPVWYVLAWDQKKNQPRTFRCDRIRSARIQHSKFHVRAQSCFKQSLEGHDFIAP